MAHRKPRGFQNTSWTSCYRRSIMQTFMNTPLILNWLRKHNERQKTKHPDCPRNDPRCCVACHLKRLADAYYWNPSPQQEFDAIVRRFDAAFVNQLWPELNTVQSPWSLRNDQQDAHEFLIFLLQSMNLEMNTPDHLTKPMNRHLYNSLFTLHTQTHWICPQCHRKNGPVDQRESGRIVQTTTGTGLTAQRYFDASFQDEVQGGMQCEHCQAKNQKATRRERIVAAPAILFVVLRFMKYERGTGKKVDPRIVLSQDLDISKHRPRGYRSEQSGLHYKLKHVVHHEGRTTEAGHYFGRYTCPTGPFELDDRRVIAHSPVNQYQIGPSVPYILLYERWDDDNLA